MTNLPVHASTTGNRAHASTTGYAAHASTTGYAAHASTTGYAAHASTTGYGAHASTTGRDARASTTGPFARASTTGYDAPASTRGYGAHASTTGPFAHASTTGDSANASTTGDSANASTAGYAANAFALGQGGCAVAIWPTMAACGPGGYIAVGYTDQGGRRRLAVGYEGEDVAAGVGYRADPDGRLVPIGKVLLVDDGRGYTVLVKDGVYIAGCRRFNIEEARAHWGNSAHHAPQSAAAILAAIEAHAASEAAS